MKEWRQKKQQSTAIKVIYNCFGSCLLHTLGDLSPNAMELIQITKNLVWLRNFRVSARGVWRSLSSLLLAACISRYLRSLVQNFWWHRSMASMICGSVAVNLRKLLGRRQRYRIDIHQHHERKEEYAVWWPKDSENSKASSASRLWVLVPGGMSDGDSIAGYIDEFLYSNIIAPSEDWCIFHNAGTGGAQWQHGTFTGLSDPTFLLDFLQTLKATNDTEPCCHYREIITVGFSVGGMLALAAADKVIKPFNAWKEQEDKSRGDVNGNTGDRNYCRLRFVSVHSPDCLRTTFEAMTKWAFCARLDIPLSLHFWAVNLRSGLLFKCPRGPWFPWPPTWSYIRRFTEAAWAQNQALKHQAEGNPVEAEDLEMPFEHFADAFALRLRKTFPAGEVLRIQNPEDPVVDRTTLDQRCLTCCDIWWVCGGGHVMCFGARADLARRFRKWVDCKVTHAEIWSFAVQSSRYECRVEFLLATAVLVA